jgi:hypothetical protein
MPGEDFTAVPSQRWWELAERQRAQGWALLALVCVMILLVWTLVSKGVLSSWADLFTVPRANG